MASFHPTLVLSSRLNLLHCDFKSVGPRRKRNPPFRAFSNSSVNNCKELAAAPTKSTPTTEAPWEITRYLTKKIGRPIDKHGNIIDSLENTADWFAWTDDAKLQLAADVLSPKLGISSEFLIHNVAALKPIIPGGAYALKKMKPADLVRLASKIEDVPAKLIELREALPPCIDVANLISIWPDVLLLPIDGKSSVKNGYQAVLDQFKDEIGKDGVNKMLKTTPQLLDSQILADVIRGSGHLMPLRQLASSLARNEDYWMQFQTLEKEPRNDYEDTLNDDVYYWKEDVHRGGGIRGGGGGGVGGGS
ncbi:hypothetical protein Ndes2526B_g02457 [Nannochloris sp. 'desiccata']